MMANTHRHAPKHWLVTGITGLLLVGGMMANAAPVAADELQAGVIQATGSGEVRGNTVLDDRYDRDQVAAATTTGAGNTGTANTAFGSVNSVPPVLAAPATNTAAFGHDDYDRD